MRVRQRQVLTHLRSLLDDPTVTAEELADAAITVLERRLGGGV